MEPDAEHGSIEVRDGVAEWQKNGKTIKFEVPIRTFELRFRELSVAQVASADEDAKELARPRYVVSGVANLGQRDTIGIIGDDASRGSQLKVTFRGVDDATFAESAQSYAARMAPEWEKEKVARPNPITRTLTGVDCIPTALISFSPAEWELGNDNEWWASLTVSQQSLDELIRAIETDHVMSLSIAIHTWGLYSNQTYSVPAEMRFNWYALPSKMSPHHSEWTHGAITGMTLTRAKRALVVAGEQPIEGDGVAPQSVPEQVSSHVRDLAEQARKLNSRLTWILWLLAGILAVLLIRFPR